MLNRILLFSAILLLIRCSQEPEDVIEGYLAAESWQDRLAFVYWSYPVLADNSINHPSPMKN